MKYINDYLEKVFKIKPIGKVTLKDTDYHIGVKVLIDGKDTGIHLIWKDYAKFLEDNMINTQITDNNAGNGQLECL